MNKKMIMGLAAGLMALGALQAPPAEAKGKGFHGHKHHHHKHFVFKWHKWHKPHYVYYNDCGYYFFKWKSTGKYFWKNKYFACKGFY